MATTQAPADLSTTPTARARAGAGADRTVPASSAARALVDRSPIEPPPQTPSASCPPWPRPTGSSWPPPTPPPARPPVPRGAGHHIEPGPDRGRRGRHHPDRWLPVPSQGSAPQDGHAEPASGPSARAIHPTPDPHLDPPPGRGGRTRPPDFVNLGLRALGRLLHDVPADELPHISGLWVSHNRMVLALADDSPRRPPPAPFTPFADGSGWSLEWSHFDEIRAIARGANGPLPC